MACKFGFASVSSALTSCSSPAHSQLRLLRRSHGKQRVGAQQHRNAKGTPCDMLRGVLKLKAFPDRRIVPFATFKEQQYVELDPEPSNLSGSEDISQVGSSSFSSEGTNGKSGFISFYNRPYKRENGVISVVQSNKSSLLWFLGPTVLVSSFIFPSLYLRRIISAIFEDSLLTDFLILFFTEALFYCGVATFLLIIGRLRRSAEPDIATDSVALDLGQQISYVATLVLSLIIPMVTMGLVWPWTGPAASATLAPYLVGILVQFAFEQYARYRKSPSWPVIPIIFQVYRLHQLNRAAQLVTALSFTVRGTEMTSHNIAIKSSLGTLLNVLQVLGVICIWSLSSFLMRFFPPTIKTTQ